MPQNLSALRGNLSASPFARAKFLSDTLGMLKDNGLDVDDQAVLDELKLDLNLNDGRKFMDGLAASTVVITIIN